MAQAEVTQAWMIAANRNPLVVAYARGAVSFLEASGVSPAYLQRAEAQGRLVTVVLGSLDRLQRRLKKVRSSSSADDLTVVSFWLRELKALARQSGASGKLVVL